MAFLPEFDYDWNSLLFYGFSGMALVHVLFVCLTYGRLAFYKRKAPNVPLDLPPVSVIIAARNESENLYEHLPSILNQDYPGFEVIVVNNQSIDDSSYLLAALQRQHPNLKVIEVARSQHIKPGKKLPLTLGIKAAKNELLLFTDADCQPNGNQWLKSMTSHFTVKQELVLGFGPYYQERGFLNRWIRFDTTWTGMNYFSFALAGMPYMGVGRNLGYTKTLFQRVNGFRSHYAIPSGDDDLFVQEAAAKRNYSINLDPESFCYSKPHQTWQGWLRQKSRHFSTSDHYKLIKKALLGIYPMTLLIILGLLITLLLDTEFRWITLIVFGFITTVKWWMMGLCFSKLQQKKFIPFLPIWDICYALILPVLFYTSEKKARNQW